MTANDHAKVQEELKQVRDAIHDLGTDWTGPTADRVLELYRVLHAKLPALRGSTTVKKDVRYGPAERNVMDIYIPDASSSSSPKPVLVFFHGGGFFAGDKAWTEDVYSNIGYAFAKCGIVVVIPNYQLVPHCSYPAPADDVQKVREWIHANIASPDYGSGSPSQVVLVGQSAGGSHIATNLYSRGDAARAAKEVQDPPVAGVAYLSAPFYFDHTKARRAQTLHEYYGSDQPDDWKHRSPVGLLQRLPSGDAALDAKKLPTMLLVGEYDPKEIVDANVMFFDAYRAASQPKGILPLFHVLPEHNHISNVLSIGTEDDAQFQFLLNFVRKCCRV